MGYPKTTLVREVVYGGRFLCELGAHRVIRVVPTRCVQVGQDFVAIGQMHEGSASSFLLEVSVAKLDESRVLFTAFPAKGFDSPERAFSRGTVAIMSREQQ